LLSSGHWFFFAAVALLSGDCVGVLVGVCYFHVVFVDYCSHVVHATVADFDVVFVGSESA